MNVEGNSEGARVGSGVGPRDGNFEGNAVGPAVGDIVGVSDITAREPVEGLGLGVEVTILFGLFEGSWVGQPFGTKLGPRMSVMF